MAKGRLNVNPPETPDDYTRELAKLLQNLKKDLGATSVVQGYKGTGSKKHRRQIWIHLQNDHAYDLWLNATFIQIGGVAIPFFENPEDRTVRYLDTPRETYDLLVTRLAPVAANPGRNGKAFIR